MLLNPLAKVVLRMLVTVMIGCGKNVMDFQGQPERGHGRHHKGNPAAGSQ